MYGIGLDPDVKSLVGNQNVPYIFEDLVSHKTLADAFMKMHEMDPTARKELGIKAMNHAHRDYDLDKVISDWDSTLGNLINEWKTNPKQTWTHTEL